jgi:Helicase HerA, central domain
MNGTLAVQFADDPPAATVSAGRLVSIAGAHVIALLDGDSAGAAQMGCLVTMGSPHATVYGVIDALSKPLPVHERAAEELMLAEIGLLGEVPHKQANGTARFRRGVSNLPSLDTPVHLADQAATDLVYAFPGRPTITVGAVAQNPNVPARIGVNDLLSKHFAMLGTTGTGKSCALTLILKRILEQSLDGHVLLLDPHGEYGRAFGDRAEHLTAKNFKLPFWLFTFEELVDIVLGDDPAKTADEAMHLRDLVLTAKLAAAGQSLGAAWITPDTPLPYSMGDLHRYLDAACGRMDNRANVPSLMRLKARLASLQMDKRFAFMFDTGLVVRDQLPDILGRLFRVPADGRPIAILDLSSVRSEVLNCVVAVVCRLAFDFAAFAGQDYPLLLVCEEAHRYAPQDARLGFGPAKRALARIAKGGRKYGIGLGLISQRPSELSSAILSQCNTVFAFRMLNERDQEIIQANLVEASPSMFSALPFLGNSEALVIGEGVPVPMRLRFAELPEGERPQSHSASFSERWRQSAAPTPAVMADVVQNFRGHRNGGPNPTVRATSTIAPLTAVRQP